MLGPENHLFHNNSPKNDTTRGLPYQDTVHKAL